MNDYILSQWYMAVPWGIIAGNFVTMAYYEFHQIKEDKTKIVAVIFNSATALMAGGMTLVCALNGLEKLISQ